MAIKDELRNLELADALLEQATRCIAKGDTFGAQHVLDEARVILREAGRELLIFDNTFQRPPRGDRRSGEDRRHHPRAPRS